MSSCFETSLVFLAFLLTGLAAGGGVSSSSLSEASRARLDLGFTAGFLRGAGAGAGGGAEGGAVAEALIRALALVGGGAAPSATAAFLRGGMLEFMGKGGETTVEHATFYAKLLSPLGERGGIT